MALSAGLRFGPYRIVALLGAGGMGEVYRARDTKLERDVALKILPASSFSDPDARSRLLREARSAAALNHPYICTIHEVGEADGQAYIAMELVDGQPISSRLAGGALPHPSTVTEQELLDLEREAFLSLVGERKTLERIQHTLKTGKTLRN